MGFDVKPKFVTFDMNGTLIKFRINDAIRQVLGDRLPAEIADEYLRTCKAYRIDECMGDYKPFHQIVASSMERASRRVGLEYREDDARAVYDIVPTWGPYPGVTEALNRLAEDVPAGDRHEQRHRARRAPRGEPQGPVRRRHHRRADGRLQASARVRSSTCSTSSARHPTRSCTSPRARCTTSARRPSMGIENKVYVDRGFEHDEHWLGYERITDIADLPVLLGLPRP